MKTTVFISSVLGVKMHRFLLCLLAKGPFQLQGYFSATPFHAAKIFHLINILLTLLMASIFPVNSTSLQCVINMWTQKIYPPRLAKH